jgi:metallo-beta-lactamase family protein
MSSGDRLRLRFLGGAGTVTGSRFLAETPQARVLVDCGLFQGQKALRERNWEPFPVDPARIDAVVLTHAHVDHSGYLPALVARGFRGPVFATRGTRGLCEIVLPDSGRLHEEDAAYANRKGFSKHAPALPLYTEEDAHAALALFRTVAFDEEVEVAPGVRVRLRPAGHILGASLVELEAEERRLAASGDLGRPDHPLLVPPAPVPAADALLVESTYGDREHADADPVDRLAEALSRVAGRGGVAVIPAFAVDRTEILLLHLRRLVAERRIPDLPVYVDSPMALAALAVYRRAVAEGWEEVRPALRGAAQPFDPGRLEEVHDVEASKALVAQRGPFVVISASGMATGGRVLHHLRARLPDRRNAVLLVGYQVPGTRGRRLLAGERALKMHGRYVPVQAEVVDLSGFSAHADGAQILAWLGAAAAAPATAFVVHGEPDAAAALAARIGRELGWPAVVPSLGEQVRV